MVLDIIIVVIFLISTIRGKVNGFGDSVLRLGSLVVGVFLGTMLTPSVSEALMVTSLDESIRKKLSELITDGQIDIFSFIPGKIGEMMELTGMGNVEVNLDHFTNTLVLVLSFSFIVLLVILIATVLRFKLKKDRKEGNFIGTVDSSIGFLLGMVKGIILVFIFLAFMFPFAGVFLPDKIHAINESLNNSYIAGPLYDINPLILFVRNLPF